MQEKIQSSPNSSFIQEGYPQDYEFRNFLDELRDWCCTNEVESLVADLNLIAEQI